MPQLLLLILLGILSPLSYGQNVAKIIYLKGDVSKFSNNQHQKLMNGVYINEGEVLNTGNKSIAVLSYGSGSKVKLGENSSLVIKPMKVAVKKASTLSKAKHFLLKKGDVIFNIQNKSDKEQLKLHTKSVAVGVRGTIFFVHEDENGQATTIVLEGKTSVKAHDHKHEFEVPEGHGSLHSDKVHAAKFKANAHAGLVNWNFEGDLHHDKRLFEELDKKHKANHPLNDFIENARNVNMQEIYTHLNNGVAVDGYNKNHETAMGLATYYNEFSLIEVLLKNGADPTHPSRLYNNSKKEFINQHFESPIHILARNLPKPTLKLYELKMVEIEKIVQKFILAKREALNARNSAGETPLMLAISGGKNKVSENLINNGADVLAQDKMGQNLMFKLNPERFNDFQFLQIFFKLDKKLFQQLDNQGRSSSHFAAEMGWWKIFRNFVPNADHYAITKEGDSILMLVLGVSDRAHKETAWEARKGYALAFSRDLKLINLQNQKGETALIRAAQMNNTQAGLWLLQYGASVSPRDTLGRSALSYAQKNNNIELINALKAKGAK